MCSKSFPCYFPCSPTQHPAPKLLNLMEFASIMKTRMPNLEIKFVDSENNCRVKNLGNQTEHGMPQKN